MVVKICVGSSCHLKGSAKIVELFTEKLKEHSLESSVELCGSFCIGECNRLGVTVQVDEKIHNGITPENFNTFFQDEILNRLNR